MNIIINDDKIIILSVEKHLYKIRPYLRDFIFDSLKNRYQNNLESVEGSEFVFDYILLLHCYKINCNRGRSYTDSPAWIKKQKSNSINKKDNKCFQYAVTVVLNYEEIKKDPQRITKIKPFISKYKRKEINFYQKKMIRKHLRKIM